MLSKHRFFSTLLSVITLLFIFEACTATHSAINPKEPQVYYNSYNQVLKAVNKALSRASLRVYKTKEINDKTYFVEFYRKKYDTASNHNDPESAHMAKMTIKKISDKRTQIVIDEEEQSNMIPEEYKEKLGRDLLRELKKLLNNENDVKNMNS